jgi:hypothetical protein
MRFKLHLALLATTACVTADSPTPLEEVTSDLEQESGGFDTVDEAAAFGLDAEITAADLEADVAENDAMAASVGPLDRPDVLQRDIVLVWGDFQRGPVDEVRDWSGRFILSRGAMLVRRRLGFEEATDRVLPRTSPTEIEFRSITRPRRDGLVIRVFDDLAGEAEPIRLRYESLDGTRIEEIELRNLDERPVVIHAGEGNRMIAAGRRRNDACAHGTMRGRWHALAPNAGVYLGVVSNAAGEAIGHVRGIYGERRNGESVLFGKFIDRQGRFTGVINGNYHDGAFEARWLDRAGDHGVLHGAFVEGASLRAGGFVSRWAETSCDPR